MAIIKLTHIHSGFEEDKPNASVDFRLMSFWNKQPVYHDTSGCTFFSATKEVEWKQTSGSIFNGRFVKETPEEILALIKEEIGSDNKPCECFMGFDKEWISKEAKDKGLTFKECLFFLYFFNTISITPQDRAFKAGVEMYKKFAKATVKALGLIKEAEKL